MRFSITIALPATFAAGLNKRDKVICGTTSDATLSDCQNLVNNPDVFNAAWAGNSNQCHYTNIVFDKIDFPASNTACSGNCACNPPDQETIRQRAAALLGCGAADVNKINALGVALDGSGVCLSDGNGCGDCFDDADFTV